jgi:hypothetical protein
MVGSEIIFPDPDRTLTTQIHIFCKVGTRAKVHIECNVSDPDSIRSVDTDSESGRRSGSRRAKNAPQKYV